MGELKRSLLSQQNVFQKVTTRVDSTVKAGSVEACLMQKDRKHVLMATLRGTAEGAWPTTSALKRRGVFLTPVSLTRP